MATLESDDANILDAETVNWRLIVYPVLAALVIIICGFGYYYYQQDQRQQLEDRARAARLQAKTPEELVKVADQFPETTQATLALLSAADGSFGKRDFDGAIKAYQRIVDATGTDAELRDSAQIGLASAFESSGKIDNALAAYLVVARRGDKSPYAPFAYSAAARLDEERGNKDDERKILTEAAGLNSDSPFVKQAQMKLKEMEQAAVPPSLPLPTSTVTVPPPTIPSPITPAVAKPAPAPPAARQ